MPPLVLLLGDGDLGYAAALCGSGAVPPCRLVATTLETEAELLRRYARAGTNLQSLRHAGALVLDAVDATSLEETLLPRLPLPRDAGTGIFSRARFNFPHCTGGLKSLRGLLERTMASVTPLLAPGGEFEGRIPEVALLAGQGGTLADGERLRPWGDNWHCPLLGARTGLALLRVAAWDAPAGYVSQREPGNRDTGGKEKSFYTDGSLVHVFAHRARADLPRPAELPATQGSDGGCLKTDSDPQWLNDTSEAFEDALRGGPLLPAAESACRRSAAKVGSRMRFGPRDPGSAEVLRLCGLQVAAENDELAHEVLEHTLQPVACSTAAHAAAWKWTSSEEDTEKQLEVYWERPPSTACFPPGTASQPLGDWLVVAWISPCLEGGRGLTPATGHLEWDVIVDLEVLTMLRFDIHDRRLLASAGSGDLRVLRPILYPCLFAHEVRVRVPDARSPEHRSDPLAAAVTRELVAACGGLLVEAYELPGDEVPQGERWWRLMLQSPDHVLDDRGAYAVYQAARERLRKHLGLELR